MHRQQMFLRSTILILLIALAAPSVFAQSENRQAVSWFEIGVKENDPQKKIEAYTRAIALDPVFVEALYNLGMVYKKQQDYRLAEQFLLKAAQAKPEAAQTALRLPILYELAMTYKKLGKLKDSEETLRRAKRLAADPAMQERIAFEMGRVLYEQERFAEAVAVLREQPHGKESQADFTALIQLAENAMEMQRLYAAAASAKTNGKIAEAKALFEQIRAQNPSYKDVAKQIAELDSLLAAQTKQGMFASLYDQAQKYEAQGNWEMAIAGYENLLQQAPNYKDAAAKLRTARQQLEQNQRNAALENAYTEGVAALKARNWTAAILAFEKIQELEGNYRDVRRRLAEAQRGLERESTETVVARYYAEGVAAMKQNDLGGALAALEKVRRINPNYREVASLYAEVETALQTKVEPPAPVAQSNIDSSYQAGLTAIEQQNWRQAIAAFEQVQLLQPNYRDVVDRLAEARAALAASPKTATATEHGISPKSFPYLGSILVALVVLPLLGAIIFSPHARARLHQIRGDYATATKIYERLLANNPSRIKLYPVLANLYLLQDRRDDTAIKIYKIILQLNLATQLRDQITSIVAQEYLTEGRTDTDAIEIFEKALKNEQHPKRSINGKG